MGFTHLSESKELWVAELLLVPEIGFEFFVRKLEEEIIEHLLNVFHLGLSLFSVEDEIG